MLWNLCLKHSIRWNADSDFEVFLEKSEVEEKEGEF